MISVTLYSRVGCKLCEEVEADLASLQKDIPHKLNVVDIDSDPAFQDAYVKEIPVVESGPFKISAPFTRQDLKVILQAAADQRGQVDKEGVKSLHMHVAGYQGISGTDRFSYWLSKHYLILFNLFLLLYVGIPFLAPVFKEIGWNISAEVVYKLYRPLCHQWAFRSFFLFGEQAYYPHAAAGIPGVLTFEQVSGITDANDPSRNQARLFEGTPILGYKIALCERDVAIWGTMALFGLIYAVLGRRLPKLHWVIWVLIGMIPIGLDGFSQLISQLPFPFIQTFLPYRESSPLLRILTGFLFGSTTAWFLFPLIEETMKETRQSLSRLFYVKKLH